MKKPAAPYVLSVLLLLLPWLAVADSSPLKPFVLAERSQQEFEQAVELRDKIKNLESNQEKISDLEKQLQESIKKQDLRMLLN